MIINNEDELLSHGDKKGRKASLKVIKEAINSVDSYSATKRQISIKSNELIIGEFNYDLSSINNIFVVGAGKATYSIARAIDEKLGKRIEKGHIIGKDEGRKLDHITVTSGGHPVPNENGFEGTKRIKEICEEAGENDLVICGITGGASALMPSPVREIHLKDLKRINKMLLNSGAPIEDINTVRKHISEIKGGKLSETIHPAEIINIIVIDEIAGEPWGPTIPDTTTFKEAIEALKKHNLWKDTAKPIKNYLKKGVKNRELETPKERDLQNLKSHNVILADIKTACKSAKEEAEELGFNSMILTTKLEGESRESGIFLTSIAKEVSNNGNPIKPPSIIILGGETTVTINKNDPGEGGPSQEFVLGSSLKIPNNKKITIASIDTDGTDGPTDIAGAIADNQTQKRAKSMNLDIYENLKNHNSSKVLKNLQDTIETNSTGTNVMNLYLAVIRD